MSKDLKPINTIIAKRENCGHAVLADVCKILNVPNELENKKMISTKDLFLCNSKAREFLTMIFDLAIKYRNENDVKAEIADVKEARNELKNRFVIANQRKFKADLAYRQIIAEDDAGEIFVLSAELEVLKEEQKRAEKELEEAKNAFKSSLYGTD